MNSPEFNELISNELQDGNVIHNGKMSLNIPGSETQALTGTISTAGEHYLFVVELAYRDQTNIVTLLKDELEETRQELNKIQSILQQRDHHISELLLTDELTSLPNRKHLEQHLQQEFSRSDREKYPISLAIADIDHFKNVIDRYDRKTADHLLQAFSQSLQSAVRTGDFVARLGADEFIIVYPNTDLDLAVEVSHRVKSKVSFSGPGMTQERFSCSFGIAERRPQESGNALIKHAGMALFRAKQTGGNNVMAFVPGEYPEPLAN